MPGRNISSRCLARPMMGRSCSPSRCSSVTAELSCPLPPSTMTRLGRWRGDLPSRASLRRASRGSSWVSLWATLFSERIREYRLETTSAMLAKSSCPATVLIR